MPQGSITLFVPFAIRSKELTPNSIVFGIEIQSYGILDFQPFNQFYLTFYVIQ